MEVEQAFLDPQGRATFLLGESSLNLPYPKSLLQCSQSSISNIVFAFSSPGSTLGGELGGIYRLLR